MKFAVLIVCFLVGYQTKAYSKNYVPDLMTKVIQAGVRSPLNDEETLEKRLLFLHGPIVETEFKKYGIEYLVEVFGTVSENYVFTPTSMELSIMELSYCDFKYAKDSDLRFLRKTITYNEQGVAEKLIEFTRTSEPSLNNGICGGVDKSKTKESVLTLSSGEVEAFNQLAYQWLSN